MQSAPATVFGSGSRRRKRSSPALTRQEKSKGANVAQQQQAASGRSSLLFPSATIQGQFSNLMNGTTSGNLAFVMNRPSKAFWLNNLTRVLTRNTTNKSLQWQAQGGRVMAAISSGSTTPSASSGTATRPGGGSQKPLATTASPVRPTLAAASRPKARPQQLVGR